MSEKENTDVNNVSMLFGDPVPGVVEPEGVLGVDDVSSLEGAAGEVRKGDFWAALTTDRAAHALLRERRAKWIDREHRTDDGPDADQEQQNRDRRRRRAYQRIMSGLRLGGTLRFVTLTTSMEASAAKKSITDSFRALIMRLKRRGLLTAYFKVIEYTKAGLPHIHMIYRGRYIPQSVLSTMWNEIHLSPIVHVRAVVQHSRAARYVAKYLGKDDRARYSWSWGWVWKGFVGEWKTLVKDTLASGNTFLTALAVWEYTLDRYAQDKFWANLERRSLDGGKTSVQ